MEESCSRGYGSTNQVWDHKLSKKECVNMSRHLKQTYEDINIIVENDVADEIENDLDTELFTGRFAPILVTSTNDSGSPFSCQSKTDLLVTLGGDGTILHATSLFSKGPVPPILSFSLGTLGFLLPFGRCERYYIYNELTFQRYQRKSRRI